MKRECEERLAQITSGFRECRNAFTAIGDETRQLILLALLERDVYKRQPWMCSRR